MLKHVEKRDGRFVDFAPEKIMGAVAKAFDSVDPSKKTEDILAALTHQVVSVLAEQVTETATVESIQDAVERVLMENGHYEVGKAYILYRQSRNVARKRRSNLHRTIANILRRTDRENANVGNGPSSKLLQMAEAEGRDFMERELTSPELADAMRENIVYPHDYSWGPIGTTTCEFVPLRKLLAAGFDNGHGWIRSPKRIKTAAQLSCIIIQSNQNDQHGGQAYGWFDRDLAPYVQREYEWQLKDICNQLTALGVSVEESKIAELAWEKTRQETFQAMEGVVFNSNTMHSRAGAQVPFFSVNIGTDTTREGRLITEMLLLAYEKGLGKGEQPIFPNLIFKVKKGVNAMAGDPNFDLFQISMRVSATRLFPNYVFQDASFNNGFPEDVPTMGCRTRISWNVNKPADEQTCEGRGNISFTTNNLVGMALKATRREPSTPETRDRFTDLVARYGIKVPTAFADRDTVKSFFVLLNKYTDMVIRQLVDRYKYQCSFRKTDFPFLLNNYMGHERLTETSPLDEAWKHGTLSMGFIGLAETLMCLVGRHHGADQDADALGEEIVKFMRTKLDEATKQYSLNFSLLATPAEGLSGKFTVKDRKTYGVIPGVTDKEWYTNSFHVPVEMKISVFEKIRVEGKYHKYCNAGHISYIELDEAPLGNYEAIHQILMSMLEQDMGYAAINFPVDRCKECNHFGVIEKDECPVCGSNQISRVRRITGYLAELSQFNAAKRAETTNRKRHKFTLTKD